MNKIIDQAHIVHRTANRLRIRVPGRRLDEAFFGDLKTRLAGAPGVVAVVANPLTGSVLIDHGPEFCPAVLRAVGLAIWLDEHGAGGQTRIDVRALLLHSVARRDGGQDAHLVVAKLAFAAATGRLWSHVLELIVEWCAVALIEAVLQPMKASAQVILMPQRRKNQHPATAAAA